MGRQDRSEKRDLNLYSALQRAWYRFDFFQALRRLECVYRDRPRIGRSARPTEDPIRLAQDPSLSFANSTLSSFRPGKGGRPPRLAGYFFGLFGPNGPLPIHLTEYAYDRLRNAHDPTVSRFFDLFHHRMLSFFYRAWANARPTVSFDRPDSDWYGVHIASLIGLGMPSFRNRDAMPDSAKLYYAGWLASRIRGPEGLQAMLFDYLRVPISIQEFIGEWIQLPRKACWRLGLSRDSGTLGKNVILGLKVWEVQNRFRVGIGPLTLLDYERFLPLGESLPVLVAFIRNYAGIALCAEINLSLRGTEVPPLRAGCFNRLGWTTWLTDRPLDRDVNDMTFMPATRIGMSPERYEDKTTVDNSGPVLAGGR